MTTPTLNIAIGAELTEIRRALDTVSKDITRFKRTAEKPTELGVNKSLTETQTQIRSVARSFRNLVAGFAGLQTVTGIVRVADEAATLAARLRLATESQEQFNIAQQGTFEIAQRTRTSLAATIELYARIERSTRDLALNQETLLQLTETINQAAQISGGGPGAEAALFQLSQGLAAGQVRGEELNSVLEQTPRIAQALADGLDVPLGKLREIAAQGLITPEVFVRAFQSQREVLAEEFGQLPLTVSGALTNLSSSFAKYVNEVNESAGATQALARGIQLLADNLPAVVEAVLRLGAAWSSYYAVFVLGPAVYTRTIALTRALSALNVSLAASFAAATTSAAAFRTILLTIAAPLAALVAGFQIGTTLRNQFTIVEVAGARLIEGLLVGFERFTQGVLITGAAFQANFKAAFNGVRRAAASFYSALASGAEILPDRFGGGLAATYRSLEESIRPAKTAAEGYKDAVVAITQEADANVAAIRKITQAMVDDARARKTQIEETGGPDLEIPAIDLNTEPAVESAAALRGETEITVDRISRALSDLESRYDQNLVSLADYYSQREQLERNAIEARIANLQREAEVATTESGRVRALQQIEIAERDLAALSENLLAERVADERDLSEQISQIRQRLLQEEGSTAEVRRAQIIAEFRDLRARLEIEGRDGGIAIIDRLVNVESAKAQLAELETEFRAVTDRLGLSEAEIESLVASNQISAIEGERRLQAVREDTIQQLQELKAGLEDINDETVAPAVSQSISRVNTQVNTLTAAVNAADRETEQLLGLLENSAAEGFSIFADLIAGSENAGDALRNLAREFARSLQQMLAKQLAAKAAGLFDFSGGESGGGGGGFLGGIFDNIGNFFTNLFHTGGIVGTGPKRRTNPFIFANAPRLHDGGILGLKPGEVPAILQTGEEVLARNDPRNATNAGGDAGFRVVNVLDPRLAGDFLESAEGERTILNVIGRNPGQVRQLLG